MVGKYLLPMVGLPAFVIGNQYLAIFVSVLSIAIAATSYGVAISTFATTAQQSSAFGSLSVVILAAIGGIWVPTYIMSGVMLKLSNFSPLNWGLNTLYNIFVRNNGINSVSEDCVKLLLFSVACLALAFWYNKFKSQI